MHTFSIETVREARVEEKALFVASELRKGGEYKAWINLDAPFTLYKDNYDANDRYTGETTYTIDLTALPVPTCTCPDFAKHGNYCKHTRGIQISLDMDAQEAALEAQAAEHDALMLSCEDTQFGCDPFARY